MGFNAGLQRDRDQRMRQATDTLVGLHAGTERLMMGMMDAITPLS
jgi:hypothetical protein